MASSTPALRPPRSDLLARLTSRRLQYDCPSCGAQKDITCETVNTYFLNSYPASCSSCRWAGECHPFKAVDLSCPGCGSMWEGVHVESAGKSWLEFLSANFYCDKCQCEVAARPCQTLSFRCGSPTCCELQELICDPWTEEGSAPVRCSICSWAGHARLRKR
eukprot:TRINITY_DN49298_c0_g1_i1.p1 TRINITY_DN49298_c0_g1~~TRINITY_DN49298_c0_g1_i1.p1  ORF type:complete len:162 (-),score=8.38 TRINITY_DN49298_c0_g1_i1:21-506(-)